MKPAAVVIGAGVNELVAAHYLARAGCAVTLVRSDSDAVDRPQPGWVSARIVRELGIEPQALRTPHDDPWAVAPLAGGGRLELTGSVSATADAIRALSPRDAAKWPEFCERMHAYARVLESLYTAPPPDPLAKDAASLANLLRNAVRVRALGARRMQEFLRLMPMPVADFLDEWFECDALKGVLGAAGVMHVFHGPRSGGTAFNLLHHHVGSAPGVFRPPLSDVRAALLRFQGVEMRSGSVERVEVSGGKATGVTLASGETLAATVVVAGLAPERALLRLIDPGLLDPELVRAVRNVRSRGVVALVDLVLDRPAGFTNLVVAPALDYLERAYDDAKYGRISTNPYLEARAAAAGDARGSRVRVHVQYVPHALRDEAWDTARAAGLGRAVVARLEEHAPGLAGSVIEQHVRTPKDLERIDGFPQGQAYHAELALDQVLWMRPVPALAQYRTPVTGFYLCGPALHPGAGTAGAAGANAASVILQDLKTKRV